MPSMTETAGTDDQQSDDNDDNDDIDENGGPSTSAEGATKPIAKQQTPQGSKPWPVDRRNHATLREMLRNLYLSLSYSYMNPIFEKGVNQFKSGEHLDLEDLFEVPPGMSSAYLVEKFWYVF